jgi:hypothetical protein
MTKNKTRQRPKREKPEVAVEIIKLLDGYSIEDAKNVLTRAATLLTITQVVSAKSPFLS